MQGLRMAHMASDTIFVFITVSGSAQELAMVDSVRMAYISHSKALESTALNTYPKRRKQPLRPSAKALYQAFTPLAYRRKAGRRSN